MKKYIGLASLVLLIVNSVDAQVKPTVPTTKHVTTAPAKKHAESASKKTTVLAKKEENKNEEKVVKKEEKKTAGHKHAHQAKVVKF